VNLVDFEAAIAGGGKRPSDMTAEDFEMATAVIELLSGLYGSARVIEMLRELGDITEIRVLLDDGQQPLGRR
jgi:hypothetical protein